MTFEEHWGYPRGDLRLCLEKHKTPLEAERLGRLLWNDATAAEREACAVTVEKTLLPQNITDAIAALIRARSDD